MPLTPSGWDMRGGSMYFDREEWGVIVDALIQHREHAKERKTVNSESTSNVRAEMCADLIRRINAESA